MRFPFDLMVMTQILCGLLFYFSVQTGSRQTTRGTPRSLRTRRRRDRKETETRTEEDQSSAEGCSGGDWNSGQLPSALYLPPPPKVISCCAVFFQASGCLNSILVALSSLLNLSSGVKSKLVAFFLLFLVPKASKGKKSDEGFEEPGELILNLISIMYCHWLSWLWV